ncbi:NHL repeat-containing protein [Photobacterium alginatilyticum]|uniref:NHL repeat-containing protein n=1 Tax=Photobacterium alginatilyticum TaxID=1775171 RepID=UPI0040698CA6
MGIEFQSYIGSVGAQLPALPCPIEGHVSLNTPVGSCLDHFGNVWLADTAHNRILVFDSELNHVMAQFGSTGEGPQQFNMPFRLLAHPTKNWIYVSDISNQRIHILHYDANLSVQSIHQFGNEVEVDLKGPNGLAFYQGELCVADEFYEGAGGASRLAIFSEAGQYLRSIHEIEGGKEPIHLLWPQGLSMDDDGLLYVANTGFDTVVRCDWHGKGEPFASNGKCYLDGLELARDVSVIQNRILIPGAKANAISIYDIDGELQGSLDGFFAPIQITQMNDTDQLLITEPILASLQLHQVSLPSFSEQSVGKSYIAESRVVKTVGDDRGSPGQFHFVTAVAGGITQTNHQHYRQKYPLIENWLSHQFSLQEQFFKAMQPAGMPSWLNLAVTAQSEWVQRWQQTWLRVIMNDRFEDPKTLLWMVDAGNYQLQASDNGQADSASPVSLPMLPGSLGIAAYKPKVPLPGQVDHEVPMIVVGNYLSGIVSLLQYDSRIGELVPYTFFGGLGAEPWQLSKPQGITIDPATNDILIADSGNHRISRWRIDSEGEPGLVGVFGKLGAEHGEFHTPSDIAATPNGLIYITDQFNNRIEVYDADNQWKSSFGQEGYGASNDNFLLPTSIDYDSGHLFISDLVNRSIKVFDLEGNFVDSFSGFGADPGKGQLWMPYLLHVNNSKVYLPDCALNRINVYHFDKSKKLAEVSG